jgi:peptidoglycan lytic transglycosylase
MRGTCRSLIRSSTVRRFALALLLVALGACAHDSNPRAARAPSAAPHTPGSTSSAATLPTAEPDPLAPDDAALTAHFQAAPAISILEGEASYYSDRLSGHKTASGERYRPTALTAAHRSLPLGTVLRVTRSDGKRTVYVRVNDRGPFGRERRILDLSRAAFQRLGKLRAGVLEVRAEVVEYGKKRGR